MKDNDVSNKKSLTPKEQKNAEKLIKTLAISVGLLESLKKFSKKNG